MDKCKPIWGLNKEGEINGAWRDTGVKGLWYMAGVKCYYLFFIITEILNLGYLLDKEILHIVDSIQNMLHCVCAFSIFIVPSWKC